MNREIEQFTNAIGAKAPRREDRIYEPFKILFKRPNYFLIVVWLRVLMAPHLSARK